MSYEVVSVYDPEENTYSPRRYPVNFNNLLEQVNRIRLAIGIGEGKLEALPPGEQDDPHQCVLARALSNGWEALVDGSEILLTPPSKIRKTFDFYAASRTLRQLNFKAKIVDEDGYTIRDFHSEDRHAFIPDAIYIEQTKAMGNFISRFDDGQFPDLILKG